jgi:hypothetical protein
VTAILVTSFLKRRRSKGHMPTVIERAFELAASGRFNSLTEVEYALNREDYELVHVHMRSPSLRKDLARVINKSDDENPDPAETA